MEKNKEDFNEIVNQLKVELEKIVMATPPLLRLLGHEKIKISFEENNKRVEYEYDPETIKKFRVLEKYKSLIFFIVGFAFCSLIMVFCYVLMKNKPDIILPDPEKDFQKTLSFLFSAMPILISLFSIVIGYWAIFLRAIVDKEDFFNKKVVWGLLLTIFVGIITVIASNLKHELLLFVCPLLGCIVILFSFVFIYNPLSSRRLNKTIIDNAELIQNKLDSLNKSIVHKSHSEVLERIEQVEQLLCKKDMDEKTLSKLHSLTVLDSLRLELIQNSINGINLVEDWKYLDLSQKMIDDILSCNNDRITMLGDLSFLSTEDGLEKLVNAIDKNKTFDIYFTGKEENGSINSKHCQELVNLIRKKYSNNEKTFNKIKSHMSLYPILSQSFTGIGYIGLHTNDSNSNSVKFDKVYAYISSHLIEEKDIDITRANPFVFTWSSQRSSYFEEFMRSALSTNQLKVIIDGQPKERTEILSFNSQTKKHKR